MPIQDQIEALERARAVFDSLALVLQSPQAERETVETARAIDAAVTTLRKHEEVLAERGVLVQIIHDIYWMARRYADGRQSYAVGMYNDAIRKALALGVPLRALADDTLWARDGMGRSYDGLTDDEAAQGRKPDKWWNDTERWAEQAEADRNRLAALVESLATALRPFAELDPSTACPADGSENENYCFYLDSGDKAPDFTGIDLARARQALAAARGER